MRQRLEQLLTQHPHLEGRRVRLVQAAGAVPGPNPLAVISWERPQLELMEIVLGFRNVLALNGDLTL